MELTAHTHKKHIVLGIRIHDIHHLYLTKLFSVLTLWIVYVANWLRSH
uniref:Uncharacterized protein n=1 Tax=Arundo donax TaxID=35708 RepID=A0A0A9DD74_ARUDO